MQTSLAKKIFAVGASGAMVLAAMPFVASADTAHAAGTNVLSNGTIYFINAAGQKQGYTSAGAFTSYGFNSWSNVVAATAADMALPNGSLVPPADGSVINDNGTVYVITNGQRAGVANPTAFLGLGYSWNQAVKGDTSFLTTLAPITSASQAHLPGTLINKDGTVYLVGANGLLGIPTPAVFNSWGYSWNSVVLANSYDRALPSVSSVMPTMALGYLNPLAQLASGSTTTPTPTGSGQVNVSLASTNPASGSVAKGAKATLAAFNVTAGAAGATINTFVVHRIGLSSDSDVTNLYLYNDATNSVLSYGSFNNGVVTFTGSPLLNLGANASAVVSVRADMSSTATVGDSIGYAVSSASDVPGVSASGSFPINGNLMTVAGVTNLGALNVTSAAGSVAGNLNPGTTGATIGYFQFVGSNQPLSVNSLKLTVIGSVSNTDIQNIALYNGSTQVGSAMQLGTDKTVTFSGAPLFTIPSGSTVNLYVKGDVVGGSNRNFQFTIQRTADITVVDNTYNTGIVPTLANGTAAIPTGTNNQVTVNAGTATLQVDSASATGNIATGANAVPLATFDFTSSGEDVRVSSITTTETTANITAGNTSDYLKNGKLVDTTNPSNPIQIGSTTNLNLSTKTGTATTATTTFSVPGYWTIPAGTTRKLTVYADTIAGNATLTAATAAQLANTNNSLTVGITSVTAQGVNSLQTVTFASSTGRTLNFASGSLTAAANPALLAGTSGAPTAVPGQTSVRVASFQITAGSAEAANVTQLTLTSTADASANLQNVKVMVNGSQVGTTQATLSGTTAYTFNPSSSIVVPAGSSVVVDVYADVLTGATTASTLNSLNLTAVSATGAVDNTSLNWSGTATGQSMYIATAGTLTVSQDSQAPTASQLQQLPMGASQQTLNVFNLKASNAEALQVTGITVTDTETSGAEGDLQNFKLYVNGTQVGPTVVAESGTGTTGTITFNMQNNPLTVPQNSNISVYLKADVTAYPNATSGNAHSLALASGAVTGRGAVSGTATGTSAVVAGVSATVYRTTLSIAKDSSSPSGLGGSSATQTVGVMNITNAANAANQQATFLPSSAGTQTDITFNINSTITPSTTGLARSFKVFKSTDLVNPVLAATFTTAGTPGTWTGTVAFGYGIGGAAAGSVGALFTPSTAWGATTSINGSSVTVTPQTVNAGVTTQYVVQFDTTDAASQKTFTLSLQTQGSNAVWNDGATNVSTLMGLPVTFGTLTY